MLFRTTHVDLDLHTTLYQSTNKPLSFEWTESSIVVILNMFESYTNNPSITKNVDRSLASKCKFIFCHFTITQLQITHFRCTKCLFPAEEPWFWSLLVFAFREMSFKKTTVLEFSRDCNNSEFGMHLISNSKQEKSSKNLFSSSSNIIDTVIITECVEYNRKQVQHRSCN